MVKKSESAIKTVTYNKRKWLSRLTKTVIGNGKNDLVVRSRDPLTPWLIVGTQPGILHRLNVETSYVPFRDSRLLNPPMAV